MKSDHIFWSQPETVFVTLSELTKCSFLVDQLNSKEVVGRDTNFFYGLARKAQKMTKGNKCETKQTM